MRADYSPSPRPQLFTVLDDRRGLLLEVRSVILSTDISFRSWHSLKPLFDMTGIIQIKLQTSHNPLKIPHQHRLQYPAYHQYPKRIPGR